MKLSYVLIILLLTTILFLAKGVFGFLFVRNFAGTDLVGNFSFVWLMHKLLGEGRITGWTNLWFAGMPAFTFYPPLFFIVAAVLNYLTLGLLSLRMAYVLVVFVSLFFFPLVVYFSFKRIGFKKDESLFISLWSLVFLFLGGIYGGINQTLNFGLVAQMFALNLYFLFLGEVIHSLNEKKISYKKLLIPSLLFGLIVLSHVYVLALAILSIAVLLAITRTYKTLKTIAFVTLVGLFLSSFWWIPTLINIQYAEPYFWSPMNVSQFSLLLAFFSLFVFLGFDIKDKTKIFFILLFLIVFFIGTQGLPLDKIQYDRFFFFSFLIGFVLGGMGSYNLWRFFKKKRKLPENYFMVPLIVFIFIVILVTPLYKLWESDLEIEGLIEWINENVDDGRILIESDSRLIEKHSVLMEVIPIETGKLVLNKIHLDSSISSPFTRTIRHEISYRPYDVSCELCQKAAIHPKNKEIFLHHLNLFNVKYIIATSEETKNYLNSFLTLGEKVDGFYVFEVPSSGYYEIPKYKPILIVSSLEKWKEFSREVFLDEDLYSLTFVWSPKLINDNDFGRIFVLEDDVKEFTKTIKKEDIFIKNNVDFEITSFEFNDNTINMTIDSNNNVLVLIKFSYYPRWEGNTDVYLTSPSLMFVYTKGNVELKFT